MRLFLSIFFLFIALASKAQDKLGVFTGINASSLSDGLLESAYVGSNSFTLHIGAVYERKLTETISFRPKLLFSKQGDREDFEDNLQYETTYINAPLTFKFFKQPYIIAGPQIGYLIDTNKGDIDYGDMQKFDYGVNLGLGIDVSDFFIELGLYQGLNTLIEVQDESRFIDTKATNTLIQLSLGYILGF